jgi:hypothetical protein
MPAGRHVEIYLNGVPAARATGYTTTTRSLPIRFLARRSPPQARAEVIAATAADAGGGGQYIVWSRHRAIAKLCLTLPPITMIRWKGRMV